MDNYAMWERHQNAMDQMLARRPVCSICGENIQDEIAYNINDELICPDCLEKNFQIFVEDYIA